MVLFNDCFSTNYGLMKDALKDKSRFATHKSLSK